MTVGLLLYAAVCLHQDHAAPAELKQLQGTWVRIAVEVDGRKVSFETRKKGHRVITTEKKPPALPVGRIPRISRLMVLAHHLEHLVVSGQVKDYAELARLGHVSRARITQIMNLLLLAPEIRRRYCSYPRPWRGMTQSSCDTFRR